jgi:acyl carrier protein
MVPQFVVTLDELPVNPNGKVDRDRLPAPGPVASPGASTGGAPDVVAPRTDTEARCATVLAKSLGLTTVGVTDDFFELGGHSLMAVQLAAALSEAFRAEVPTRLVFERPTVEGLAAAVDAMLVGGLAGGLSGGPGRG